MKETHKHFHNEMTYCEDYANCDGCHCHFQDEAHTECCLSPVAKLMYERRQEWIHDS